jgi:flagellar operon protein (TIGR03826 family)
MDLANCPRCGKLFAKNFNEMCTHCHQALEKDFQRCNDHLRENKGVTIQQLSEDTEVTIKQITRWIREGRISILNAPNLSYPCEVCGILIREGHMCDSCKIRFNREVKNAQSTGQLQHHPDEAKNKGAYQIGKNIRDRQ